jgi:uncharacterized glyoxalase superfamily protein PhnB
MTRDPFLDLRLDPEPVDPDPAFRARLRARLEDALTDPFGDQMSTTAVVTRKHTMTPYLCCRDARAAMDWYRSAFGAEVVGDTYPMGPDDDRLGHAELRIGDSTFYLSDEWPEGDVFSPESRGGATTSFVLDVPDVDRTFDHAVESGAQVARPVTDEPYGARVGWVVDPFGHRWSLSTPLGAAGEPAPGPEFRAEDLFEEIGYYVLGRPDLDAAKSFYGAVFGWRFAEENTTPGGFRGAHVESSLVPFGVTDDPEIQRWHPWFRVRDLDATLGRVRAEGGEVLEVTEYASGGGARCRDSQGVEFDVYQPAPGY